MNLKDKFESDGFVILRKLIPVAQIEALSQELSSVLKNAFLNNKQNLRSRYKLLPNEGVQILDALNPVTDISKVAREIATSFALIEKLEEIYGEPPRLFKDKIIFKTSGSPGYPWHQDFISWPFFPESFLTAMVAVDESNLENGCLEVIRGSHRRGYLSPRDGDFHDLPEALFSEYEKLSIPLFPGDAVIFGAFTVHGSRSNRTDSPRRQLYLSYNKDSEGGDQRNSHYRFFHSWLRRRYEEYGTKDIFFR